MYESTQEVLVAIWVPFPTLVEVLKVVQLPDSLVRQVMFMESLLASARVMAKDAGGKATPVAPSDGEGELSCGGASSDPKMTKSVVFTIVLCDVLIQLLFRAIFDILISVIWPSKL